MTAGYYPRKPMNVRFWEKVNVNGPIPTHRTDIGNCWIWTAYTSKNGYGQFGKTHRNKVQAYRVSYEMFKGGIGEGLEVDHLCRVRNCVNPFHLEAVTPRINRLRGVGAPAVNFAKTECSKGHPFSEENTKITKRGYRRCVACDRILESKRGPR